jgi:hypothetical protein
MFFFLLAKMKVTIALFCLVACAAAMPAPQDVAEIGAARHADAVKLIQQSQYDLSQPIVADVPGLAEHQAAEALVLASQGLNPGLIVYNGNQARALQAEQQLIAIQQQSI